MPSGSGGIVVDVRVFNRHGIDKDERSITIERSEIDSVQQDKIVEEEILERSIKQRASQILDGHALKKRIKDLDEGSKINEENLNKIPLSELFKITVNDQKKDCLLYTSPSPRDS